MTIFEKAQRYIDYCRQNDYMLEITKFCYDLYGLHTPSEDKVLDGMELARYLSQRYDDEKEAGNI